MRTLEAGKRDSGVIFISDFLLILFSMATFLTQILKRKLNFRFRTHANIHKLSRMLLDEVASLCTIPDMSRLTTRHTVYKYSILKSHTGLRLFMKLPTLTRLLPLYSQSALNHVPTVTIIYTTIDIKNSQSRVHEVCFLNVVTVVVTTTHLLYYCMLSSFITLLDWTHKLNGF